MLAFCIPEGQTTICICNSSDSGFNFFLGNFNTKITENQILDVLTTYVFDDFNGALKNIDFSFKSRVSRNTNFSTEN